MASSVAITVATAVYLWGFETEQVCTAPNSDLNWGNSSEYIDVSKRFRDILKIWFVVGLVDCCRCASILLYMQFKSVAYVMFYYIGYMNDCFIVAAILILHTYRLQYSGKWCAGDFLDSSATATPGFLVERGKFLIGLVIYVWVSTFVFTCIWTCIAVAAYRRIGDRQKFN